MTRTRIENSLIWQGGEFIRGHTLLMAQGRIQTICPARAVEPQPGDAILDAGGSYALPGFIDLHVHGGKNHDVMDGNAAALRGLSDFLVMHGVTSYLGTTMSANRQAIDASLAAMSGMIDEAQNPFIGAHLEGPYLNPEFRGSQPADHLRRPEPGEYLPWLDSGLIKLITLAPELDGARELILAARERGITVSIGHSGASYTTTKASIAAGISQITHTFNGMRPIHHREPGILAAASEQPEVNFQIIPDGVHVHPAMLRLLLRLVGSERVLAITDAMRATGLPDGDYGLAQVKTVVKDGVARGPDGRLAGSTLTMDQALRNMMRFCDMSLAQALPMLTSAPARSIGVYPRKGSLQVGADADVVIWDEQCGVQATLIGGKPVYQACAAATADA